MWQMSQPPAPHFPSFGIFTFSSSVQDGAKIEKDTSSYKAELNEISFSITETNRRRVVSDERFWQSLLFLKQLQVHPGFAALGDIQSNSYLLPPAVQSVQLQWNISYPSCSVCGSA